MNIPNIPGLLIQHDDATEEQRIAEVFQAIHVMAGGIEGYRIPLASSKLAQSIRKIARAILDANGWERYPGDEGVARRA